MKSLIFSIGELKDLIDQVSPLFDFVVLVDPKEHRSLYADESGGLLLGNLCYTDIGAVDHRYLDLPFHSTEMGKDSDFFSEIIGNNVFAITRKVLTVKLADGSEKVCYLDLLNAYSSTTIHRSLYEQEIIREFVAALENEEFEVYLQPQVDFNNEVLGAEALVRWNHPKKGLILPGEFIGILESAGLIHELDYYVWQQSMKILKHWKALGREDLYISVNISPKDIYYLNLVRVLEDLVEEAGVDSGNLKLEFTETTLMKDLKKHNEVIHSLHEKGFEIEIDDFGSGYSSLAVLKNLDADILKIDMEFLRETNDKSRSRIILNSVIRMAKQLGMPVITEGIEDEQQANFLRSLGSDMFQGFYFAKPLPVSDFEARYL